MEKMYLLYSKDAMHTTIFYYYFARPTNSEPAQFNFYITRYFSGKKEYQSEE